MAITRFRAARSPSRKTARAVRHKKTTLRHLWLASIGAAAVGQRAVGAAAARVATELESGAALVAAGANDGVLVLRGAVMTVEERLVAPLRSDLQATVASGVNAALSLLRPSRNAANARSARPAGRRAGRTSNPARLRSR